MEDNKIEITDNDGNVQQLTVMSLIEDPNEEKTYMIYTDNTLDEDKELKIYASIVNRDEDDNFTLEPLDDYSKMDFITKKIDEIMASNLSN